MCRPGMCTTASTTPAERVPPRSSTLRPPWSPRVPRTTLALALCTVLLPAGPGPAARDAAALPLAIAAIQGRGATSAHAGQAVRTDGVVTRLTNNGFFLQAPEGDGDEATSDGLFVFTGGAPTVQPGQRLQVSGTVTEYATGGSTVTQLTEPRVRVLGSGHRVAPVALRLPVDGGLERFEGMLVTLAGPLTVGQNHFQARYGQLTLSAGGRLRMPTDCHRPGPQAQALAAANAARRIVLDDGSTRQNLDPMPFAGAHGMPRGGDTVGAVTGVIDYGASTHRADGPGDYRIVPLDPTALRFTPSNPRPAGVPPVGGTLRLAGFNLHNHFTSFTDGRNADGAGSPGCALGGRVAPSHCRGANNLAEFRRQQAKLVAAIAALDADALGLVEVQNDGVSAQHLVAALNARLGAGTYALAPGAVAGPVGSDAIKSVIVYRPARLRPVGGSVADAAAVHSRPPVAQTFALPGGERFMLVVSHFKSKSGCPAPDAADAAGNTDAGDGQGCWNARRVAHAERLRGFVAQLQAGGGSPDVVLLGDFNAYAQEDPLALLAAHGFVDQVARFAPAAHSFVFDGAAGRLDHVLTSAGLSPRVSGAAVWHINADESPAHDYNLEFRQPACPGCAPDLYAPTPYRASDHDPVLLGLDLPARPGAATSAVAGAGDAHGHDGVCAHSGR